MSRSQWKRSQSLGEKITEARAHREQVERYKLLDGTAADKFFTRTEGDQIHHHRPIRTPAGLFKNNTKNQDRELSRLLGSGNQIQNMSPWEAEHHQGKGGNPNSAHNISRARGLEHKAKASLHHPLLKEMDEAANMPFAYKVHLAERFNKELKPKINRANDDAFTAQYEGTAKLQAAARWRAIKHISSQKQVPLMHASKDPYVTGSQLPMN